MKTYMKYFLAVSMIFAIGIAAATTASAGEKPIWHNFTYDTSQSGSLPSGAHFANTAPIWQNQVDSYHYGSMTDRAERKGTPTAVSESNPIWGQQCKCL
jgi:hypothetical protein